MNCDPRNREEGGEEKEGDGAFELRRGGLRVEDKMAESHVTSGEDDVGELVVQAPARFEILGGGPGGSGE